MKKIILLVVILINIIKGDSKEEFQSWKQEHNKKYSSLEEENRRFQIFLANKKNVLLLNSNRAPQEEDDGDAYFALNEFADLTTEEFESTHLCRARTQVDSKSLLKTAPNVLRPVARDRWLPASFSWIDKGAVTPVKNQGGCGSCWAFGAVGNMEGQWFLKRRVLRNLSEQNLVDCDHECQIFPGETEEDCDDGCGGGMEPNAFNYVIKSGGIMAGDDYPYKAREGKCLFDKTKTVANFSSWSYVAADEAALQGFLYDNGPVSIGVEAASWSWYAGGVYDGNCKTENNHAVLLVGWGEAGGKPYWLVKNSWGKTWGESGYIRLIRGKNKCGMLDLMSTIHV